MSYRSKRRNLRRRLHVEQGGRCYWCDTKTTLEPHKLPNTITIDHLLPRSIGGPDKTWNFVGACKRCNEERENRLTVRALLVLVVRLVLIFWRCRRSFVQPL